MGKYSYILFILSKNIAVLTDQNEIVFWKS